MHGISSSPKRHTPFHAPGPNGRKRSCKASSLTVKAKRFVEGLLTTVTTDIAKVAADPAKMAELELSMTRGLPLLEELLANRRRDRTANIGLFLVHTMRAALRMQQDNPKEEDEFLTRGQPYADFLDKTGGVLPSVRFSLANFKAMRGWAWGRLGKKAEGTAALQQAEADFRKLLAGRSPEAHWWLGLANCLLYQSDLHRLDSRWDKAEKCLRDAQEAWDKFLAEKPGLFPRAVTARIKKDLGDKLLAVRAKGVEEAEEIVNDKTASAERLFIASRVLSLAASREKDKNLEKRYADRCLAILRQTIDKGFKDVERLKTDTDLNFVRPREDFQALLKELQDKTKK